MVTFLITMAAFISFSAIYCNLTDKNQLLAANIEALTMDESLWNGEYVDPLDPKNPKPQVGAQLTLIQRDTWDVNLRAFVKKSSWECIKVNISIVCTIHF